MSRKLLLFFAATSVLFIIGCNDFIEINISKKTVNILAPGNGALLSSPSVTFWWDSVPGATKYELQVVSPSFKSIQYLSVDSFVTGKVFIYTLAPGKYQWRIRALNNSSTTNFSAIDSFSIDSSLNLTGVNLQIINPSNNYIT